MSETRDTDRSLWWDYLWPGVVVPVLVGAFVVGFLVAVTR